jgi:hypothetical protein
LPCPESFSNRGIIKNLDGMNQIEIEWWTWAHKPGRWYSSSSSSSYESESEAESESESESESEAEAEEEEEEEREEGDDY